MKLYRSPSALLRKLAISTQPRARSIIVAGKKPKNAQTAPAPEAPEAPTSKNGKSTKVSVAPPAPPPPPPEPVLAETEGAADEENEESEDGLIEFEGSVARHVITEDSELKEVAIALRREILERYKDPRKVDMTRFVLDYWHVPDQYTLLRTPAEVFFSAAGYSMLEDSLLEYGRKALGCRAISPVWMSIYVEGCSQNFHVDGPHGPFAFVLSLTDWEARGFTGGETMILKPQVLDFWRNYDGMRQGDVFEAPQILELVEPRLGRLTLFDPRFPHGVREVRGVRDPSKARIVLHGWFTEPSPFFEGSLEEEEAAPALQEALDQLFGDLAGMPKAMGLLSVRLTVDPSGSVSKLEWLADTLVADPKTLFVEGSPSDPESARDDIFAVVYGALIEAQFPKAKGPSVIVLPLVFE